MMNRKTGFVFAAMLALAGCRIEVHDNLTQRDANEIASLLLFANIDAKRVEKKDGTFAVDVPEDDFAPAVRLINESGLPRPVFRSMVDVFENDRLIASPSEERARLAYATSQELSQTVSEIDGVVSARVHLATPALDPLGRRVNKSSASVAIHHEGDLSTEGMVPRIKLLVSHAVDDLEYEDVLVALFPVKRSMPQREATNVMQAQDRDSAFAGGILEEMAWPTEQAQSDRAQSKTPYIARAATPNAAPFNPAIAAILAGGLLVLLVAAKGLFDRPRRGSVGIDGDDSLEPEPARRRGKT